MPSHSAYSKLVTSKRLRDSTIADRSLDDEMLSDKARVVTSNAFRRLQVKAQVFSLEENAAVRSRLTHTLEVAACGELIARKIADKLVHAKQLSQDLIFPIVTTVQNACLLHDIGNPPFGHLGEFAIRSWFASNESELKKRWRQHGIAKTTLERHLTGLLNFDGNPQALRIVTRLQWLSDSYGLNLTGTLLSSIVKYLDIRPNGSPLRKKPGFFETEKKRVFQVWNDLGLRCSSNRLEQRHPLAYLMEAADDIAYCVSDIEDAIEKRVVSEDDFFEWIPKTIRKKFSATYPSDAKLGSNAKYLGFRINLSRFLVQRVAELYVSHHDQILAGELEVPLLELDQEAAKPLESLKGFTHKKIFPSFEAINIELSGFRIVTDILDFFGTLMFEGEKEFQRLLPGGVPKLTYGEMALERRMLALLPRKHREVYLHCTEENPELEPIYRAHLIVDYVAGMTDTHAVKVFRMLRGIFPR